MMTKTETPLQWAWRSLKLAEQGLGDTYRRYNAIMAHPDRYHYRAYDDAWDDVQDSSHAHNRALYTYQQARDAVEYKAF